MRGSTSRLALAAGFALVLALAIGLFQLTRSAAQAPPAPAARATPGPPPPAAVGEPASSPVPPTAAREAPAAAPAGPRGRSAPGAQPQLVPAVAGASRELKRDANGHLVPIIPMTELRAQIDRTTAPMQTCIERAGSRATGKATLSFTVATRNGQLAVEATGIQDEDTLAGFPELLECMHRTAYALVLDNKPIPELGTPIYVRRHVRLDNGELAENTFFDFSYNP